LGQQKFRRIWHSGKRKQNGPVQLLQLSWVKRCNLIKVVVQLIVSKTPLDFIYTYKYPETTASSNEPTSSVA